MYNHNFDDGKGIFPNQNVLLEKLEEQNAEILAEELERLNIKNKNDVSALETDHIHQRAKELREAGYLTKLPTDIQRKIISDALFKDNKNFLDRLDEIQSKMEKVNRHIQKAHRNLDAQGWDDVPWRNVLESATALSIELQNGKNKAIAEHLSRKELLEGRFSKLMALQQFEVRRMQNHFKHNRTSSSTRFM